MKTIYQILFIIAVQKPRTMKTQTTFKTTLQQHVSDI